MGWNNN